MWMQNALEGRFAHAHRALVDVVGHVVGRQSSMPATSPALNAA
jgi:hypothetical protein